MEIHHTTILNNGGGLQGSYMPEAVWKNWTPPKCKLFAWLILQNHVWTDDCLEKHGWWVLITWVQSCRESDYFLAAELCSGL
jgi:hypothetical protein